MSINQLVDNLENRLYSDGKIDHITMIQVTSIIQKVVSVAAGVLSWLVIIILPLVISIEIIYICFPFIREKTNEMLLKLESKGVNNVVKGFVLKDAIKAVERAEIDLAHGKAGGTTSEALWHYIKLKLPEIFFIFFVLAFVLHGTSTIISIISNIFSGILDMLGL